MPEYISLVKNSDNETLLSPSVISVGWGGSIKAQGKRLRVNGRVNFKVLRTAFNRANSLGIESEIINGKDSILFFGVANGFGNGVSIKLRDKFLDAIIGFISVLYLEGKSKQNILISLNNCCAAVKHLCSAGECKVTSDTDTAEINFVNSLVDICYSFGYEAENIDIAGFSED